MTNQRKKILFLTPQLPYPADAGGFIKSFKLIEYLSQKHDVDYASLLKDDNATYLNEFKNKVALQNFYTVDCSIPRSIKNIIFSNIQLKPISFYRNYSKKLAKLLQPIWQNYDIIFVDHVDMFQYIPKAYFSKTILHQHNAEFVMWERVAKLSNFGFKKLALLLQAKLLKRLEVKYCNAAKLILASPNDELELQKAGVMHQHFFETYHLGDDKLLEEKPLEFNPSSKNLLYVGTLTWEANIDGLLWFLENVWSSITAKDNAITLTIVGKNPDVRLLKYKNQNVIFKGFVEDLEPEFQNAKLFIVPLRFGSGIKVKVVSAMYRGLPCITTSIGAEGLQVENGKHLLIAEDKEAFSQAIFKLINDATTWQTLSVESRKLAQEKYSWQAVFHAIDQSIAAMNNNAAR